MPLVYQVGASVDIHLSITRATPCVVMHASHLDIGAVSLDLGDGRGSLPGASAHGSTTPDGAR